MTFLTLILYLNRGLNYEGSGKEREFRNAHKAMLVVLISISSSMMFLILKIFLMKP